MGIIFDILKDIPLSAVLIERIKRIETQLDLLREENALLKEKETYLAKRADDCMKELAELRASTDQFLDKFGVKFRKIGDGIYDKTMPYCPSCKIPMSINRKLLRVTHTCSKCGFVAPFDKRKLEFLLKKD